MAIATIPDLRLPAKRRLPRFVFDYLDGGAGEETGMSRNIEALDAIQLRPRMLVNVEERDFSTTLMGKKWALPFGTAPIGFCNLMCPGGEQAVAEAAKEANIPCILSTSGTTSMEKYREYAPENAWYQLYVSRVREIADDLVKRADESGYETLVVTVDIPVAARRPRDLRNNFNVALRITPKFVWGTREPSRVVARDIEGRYPALRKHGALHETLRREARCRIRFLANQRPVRLG